jgi:hypothetical protein
MSNPAMPGILLVFRVLHLQQSEVQSVGESNSLVLQARHYRLAPIGISVRMN